MPDANPYPYIADPEERRRRDREALERTRAEIRAAGEAAMAAGPEAFDAYRRGINAICRTVSGRV